MRSFLNSLSLTTLTFDQNTIESIRYDFKLKQNNLWIILNLIISNNIKVHWNTRLCKRFPIGKEEQIKQFTARDLYHFYKTHYRINNMTLYLVGTRFSCWNFKLINRKYWKWDYTRNREDIWSTALSRPPLRRFIQKRGSKNRFSTWKMPNHATWIDGTVFDALYCSLSPQPILLR